MGEQVSVCCANAPHFEDPTPLLSDTHPSVARESKPAIAKRKRRSSRSARALRIGGVLQILARSLSHRRFRNAATDVVNQLAKSLACERVSLGMCGLRSLHVCAISNTVDISRRQLAVKSIESAMLEALEMRGPIVYPMPGNAAESSSFMHAALARAGNGTAVYTIPLIVRGQVTGALTFERNAGFDAAFFESAKDIACFVGPVLTTQYRADRPLAGPMLTVKERRARRNSRPDFSGREIAMLSALALMLIIAVWPIDLTVSSPARVQGAGQRVLAAPVDGFIQSVGGRPGDEVTAGQLLLTLDDADLTQAVEKWRVESAQLDREYRDALSQDDAAEIVVARARFTQAKVQLEQARRELARSKLTAPISGVLVSGDLQDSIGMPVKRGQELLTIAPPNAYRIVAEVDERDIGFIRSGQSAQVVFAAFSEQQIPVLLKRISPVARTVDGRNVFEVDGEISDSQAPLYHGLTGVARIDVAHRSVASVLWLRISQRLRQLYWRVVG